MGSIKERALKPSLGLAIFITAVLVLGALPASVRAADEENCLLCHRYSGMGMFEKDGTERVFYVNEGSHRQSVHGALLCSSCHTDVKEIPHKTAKKVDCSVDCHIKDPSTEKMFSHRKVMDDYKISVHGNQKLGMEKDYPTCKYCHQNPLYLGEGGIAATAVGPMYKALQRCKTCHENPKWAERFFSHVSMRMRTRLTGKEIVDLCSSCHEDTEKMARHGLESTWSLKDSFHWEGIKYDSPNAPNCITCHAPAMENYSVHNILSVKNPLSPFADKQKRVKICANQGCHPAATESFASGKVHAAGAKVDILEKSEQRGGLAISAEEKALIMMREKNEKLKSQVISLLRLGYKFLIASIIGFMFIHQVIDYLATLKERKHGGHHGHGGQHHADEPQIFFQRMKRVELYQHNINAVAFITLATTGFMALIPLDTVQIWYGQYGKTLYWIRGIIHRCAAAVMIFTTLWHWAYLLFTESGRGYIKDMLPTPKDGKDLIQFFKFGFGQGERPKCDRFDYREKLEYLTGQAGTGIVIATGLILVFASYITKFIVDIAMLVHFMEAVLATMAISIWHMYAIHVKPGKFPMTTAFIDGKLPLHEMEEEHPVYYENVIKPRLNTLGSAPDPMFDVVKTGPRKLDVMARGFLAKAFATFCILALVVVNVFLIKTLYLKGTKTTEKAVKDLTIFEKIMQAESKLKHEHFHNLDLTISVENRIPTLCLRCHGNRPHSHAKEIRSLLNMHTYFAACELCHTPKVDMAPEDKATLQINWYDTRTGAITDTIDPTKNGNYDAKLIPSVMVGGKRQRLDKPITDAYARDFMEDFGKFTVDQQAKAKAEVHKGISQKPVQCNECHRRESPYVDFAGLGYSRTWVEELTGAEVVGMVDKYLTFYIPTMFNPDEIRKQREELMRLREKVGEK